MSEAAKRRSAHTSATPPPKASRMSAAAPIFVPTTTATSKADDLDADAESSANAAAVAAAVAKSRVTRPLPNSRRQAPGADFVPKQATVPKSVEQKENTRRLIVVLSQVSRVECERARNRQSYELWTQGSPTERAQASAAGSSLDWG
jgi:rRNA small subunit pseudouridine methyltransferase Nep1